MNTIVNKIVALGALLSLFALFSCSFEQGDFSVLEEEASFQPLNPNEVFYFEEAGIYIKKTDTQQNTITKGGTEKTKVYYATRFFPKSIDEQLYLGSIEEVVVSYIPWGYDPVPDVVVTKSGLDDVNTFQTEKENPYYIKSVVDADTTILHLPVMYALWPEELDYPNVDYEVIEKVEVPLRDPEPAYRYTLTLRTYDSLLATYVPLKNMKVIFALGTFIEDFTTDSQGTVRITPSAYNNAPSNIPNIAVYVLPETSSFTVTRGILQQDSTITTTAIVEALGTLGSLFGNPGLSQPSPYTATLSSTTTEYEVFRGADYYFNDSHLLYSDISYDESGVLFIASNSSHNTDSAQTDWQQKRVLVYDNGDDMQEVISTTLHEIGHIRHYKKNQYLFNQIDDFVIESYASFVGWLLGEQYYTSKGFVRPYHGYQINWEGRQNWFDTLPTPYYYYSPIFVDLWDNYNQSALYTYGIPETIAWVPLSVIEGMAEKKTLSECLTYIQGYIGVYLTQNDYNILVEYYQ